MGIFSWNFHAFSVLMLLGRQERHPACKNWVVRYWRGYLSAARCKWFAYGPADATATHSSLASLKSRMVYLSGAGLPRLSWKKKPLNDVVVYSFRIGRIWIMNQTRFDFRTDLGWELLELGLVHLLLASNDKWYCRGNGMHCIECSPVGHYNSKHRQTFNSVRVGGRRHDVFILHSFAAHFTVAHLEALRQAAVETRLPWQRDAVVSGVDEAKAVRTVRLTWICITWPHSHSKHSSTSSAKYCDEFVCLFVCPLAQLDK